MLPPHPRLLSARRWRGLLVHTRHEGPLPGLATYHWLSWHSYCPQQGPRCGLWFGATMALAGTLLPMCLRLRVGRSTWTLPSGGLDGPLGGGAPQGGRRGTWRWRGRGGSEPHVRCLREGTKGGGQSCWQTPGHCRCHLGVVEGAAGHPPLPGIGCTAPEQTAGCGGRLAKPTPLQVLSRTASTLPGTQSAKEL